MFIKKNRYKSLIIKLFLTLSVILLSAYFSSFSMGKQVKTNNLLQATVENKPHYTSQIVPHQGNCQIGNIQQNNESKPGGVRGDEGNQLTFVALIPENNGGLTYSQYPTFFIYSDYKIDKGNFYTIQFTLINKQDEITCTQKFKLTKTPSIFHFKLSSPALNINKKYDWEFQIKDGEDKLDSVKGWIKVIRSKLSEKELNKMSPSELFNFYDERDIWYDKLMVLAEMIKKDKKEEPKLFSLLKEYKVNLGKLVEQIKAQNDSDTNIFVDCCSTKN